MSTLLPQKKDAEIEFVPFGTQSKIKLSLNIIKNLIAVPGKNGELPDERQCMRFMMLCRSRQLDPFQGDAFMIPFYSTSNQRYEWSMVTAQQAFLKRAEVHPDYNGKQSGIIINPQPCRPCGGDGSLNNETCEHCGGKGYWDELEGDFLPEKLNDEPVKFLGGWCKVYYKGKTKPEYQRLRLSTYAKKTAQWQDDPCGMICKCAEAAALRSAFPNSLGGMMLREEVSDGGGFLSPVFDASTPETNDPAQLDKISKPAEPGPTQQPEGKPKPSTTGENIKQVAVLRKELKAAGVSEDQLLEYLAEKGTRPCETLEELALNEPESFEKVTSNSGKIFDAVFESL